MKLSKVPGTNLGVKLSKKRSGQLTLYTSIPLSKISSKRPQNCAISSFVYMPLTKCNRAKYQGHIQVAHCPKKGRDNSFLILLYI